MNLTHLSDQSLLQNTRTLAGQERELTLQICHHLREIERRRLFSALKYSSLLEYAMAELKYSETQAIRRISAMRLLRDLPYVETKLATGELSLSNAVLAQTLFAKEKRSGRAMSESQKNEVLNRISGLSIREAKKIVGEINPEMKNKPLTFDMIDDELLREKLIQAKGRFAHLNPAMSLNELLHKLCDLALRESAPARPRVGSRAETVRQVWRRAGSRCERCGSTHALEIDHIRPRALGGGDYISNLRLLCRACNQRAAIEKLGSARMSPFLKSPWRDYGSRADAL